MACSKDQGCLTIANSIYPGLRGEIGSSIQKINGTLDSITSELNSLTIPDDYLGSMVKEKLGTIIANFGSDKSNVNAIKGQIDAFIGEKIEEHLKHYENWKRAQEELKKKKHIEMQ